MLDPIVSIITPVYNGAIFLAECIESIQQQDYPNIEHIVIDDGSQDKGKTIEVLKKYGHITWWARSNVGQYPTMNEGLKKTNGSIVCFFSADDIMCPGTVSSSLQKIQSQANLDGVYGKIEFIRANGEKYPVSSIIDSGAHNLYPYFRHLSHASLFIKKDYLIKNDLFFSEEYNYTGDYEWFIRLIRSGIHLAYIPKYFAQIRLHEGQSSSVFRKKIHDEHMVILSKYNINKLGFYLVDKIIIYRGAIIRLWEKFRREGVVSALNLFWGFLLKRLLFKKEN